MIEYILLIIGGLLLFLYGIQIISINLTKISGSFIKKLFSYATKNDFLAIIIGILITCIFNSSSAICVFLITFLTAKLIDLRTSLFIMMGSNIGTTITSYIISLDITKFYMIFIILGCFILLIDRFKRLINYGYISFGLGIFFMGINFMSSSTTYLINSSNNVFFYIINDSIINNLLVSTIFTSIIQSSTAMIKITQQLYNLEVINLSNALIFTIGANIGTTVTGTIACIKASKEAKYLAYFNVLFNILTTIFVLLCINRYIYITELVKKCFNLSFNDTVTFFHFLFNFTGLLIISPFIKNKKITPN